MELVDRDLLVDGDRDDLLGEHVERVARDPRLLDLAAPHRAGDDGGLEQVGAELREDAPLRDRAQLVAGATDALEPAGDRLRRLDLDHEVDRAHVDSELERRGRDEAGDPAGLQLLLDHDALLAGEAAVVRAGDLAAGELVQPQGEALGEAAVVDEDDRRAVCLDELQELGVHRRPDRRDPLLPSAVGDLALREDRVAERGSRSQLPEILDRHDDLEIELLAGPGVDERDRAAAGDETPDLLERPLGGGEPEPLNPPCGETLQPFHREREMRAALGTGDRVDLVEDQRLDAAQALAGRRGEHQVERLGRRDQDVRRRLHELAAVLRRRVPGADADPEARAQTRERAAKVALDVVVERLQRRDVEDPHPRSRRRVQAVDRVEERRERLPGAGRCLDEDVAAGGDRRPAQLLRGRRPGKRVLEPASGRG